MNFTESYKVSLYCKLQAMRSKFDLDVTMIQRKRVCDNNPFSNYTDSDRDAVIRSHYNYAKIVSDVKDPQSKLTYTT